MSFQVSVVALSRPIKFHIEGYVICDDKGNPLPGLPSFSNALQAEVAREVLEECNGDLTQFPQAFYARLAASAKNKEKVQLLLTYLQELGWSQVELARRTELDPNTVSRWLTGRVAVPAWSLEYLRVLVAIKRLGANAGVL